MRAVRFCFVFYILSILTLRGASSLAVQYTLTDVGPGINSAINASGQLTWSNGHAILWTPTTPNGTSGTTTDLGLLGGTSYSFGSAINASGQVVGGFSNDGGISHHDVLWTPDTPNGRNRGRLLPPWLAARQRARVLNSPSVITTGSSGSRRSDWRAPGGR